MRLGAKQRSETSTANLPRLKRTEVSPHHAAFGEGSPARRSDAHVTQRSPKVTQRSPTSQNTGQPRHNYWSPTILQRLPTLPSPGAAGKRVTERRWSTALVRRFGAQRWLQQGCRLERVTSSLGRFARMASWRSSGTSVGSTHDVAFRARVRSVTPGAECAE